MFNTQNDPILVGFDCFFDPEKEILEFLEAVPFCSDFHSHEKLKGPNYDQSITYKLCEALSKHNHFYAIFSLAYSTIGQQYEKKSRKVYDDNKTSNSFTGFGFIDVNTVFDINHVEDKIFNLVALHRPNFLANNITLLADFNNKTEDNQAAQILSSALKLKLKQKFEKIESVSVVNSNPLLSIFTMSKAGFMSIMNEDYANHIINILEIRNSDNKNKFDRIVEFNKDKPIILKPNNAGEGYGVIVIPPGEFEQTVELINKLISIGKQFIEKTKSNKEEEKYTIMKNLLAQNNLPEDFYQNRHYSYWLMCSTKFKTISPLAIWQPLYDLTNKNYKDNTYKATLRVLLFMWPDGKMNMLTAFWKLCSKPVAKNNYSSEYFVSAISNLVPLELTTEEWKTLDILLSKDAPKIFEKLYKKDLIQYIDENFKSEDKDLKTMLREQCEEGLIYCLDKKTSETYYNLLASLIDDTNNGQTPLHWVGERGNYTAWRFFLENGADIHQVDAEGNTPKFSWSNSK